MDTEKNNQLKGSEHIEVKKSAKANLEQHKLTWLLVGFVVVFAFLYVALEFTTFEYKEEKVAIVKKQAEIKLVDTVKRFKIIKPKTPPQPKKQVQQKVQDKIEIMKEEAKEQETEVQALEDIGVEEVSDVEEIYVDEGAEEEEVFDFAEDAPEFPGGTAALMKYLGDNIKYPRMAREMGSQGRVFLRFIVGKDGSIANVEVIKSSGDKSLDDEAVRVVQAMPKWQPGKQAGRPVNVKYTLPVNFKLQ